MVNLALSAVFLVFGVLARKRKRWAFIAGMILCALDGLLFIWFQDGRVL